MDALKTSHMFENIKSMGSNCSSVVASLDKTFVLNWFIEHE